MARIERTVGDLVADDTEMRDAVETVLSNADDGTVRWADVRDEVSSGHWGRLIEQGVLVDGEDGFELADPEATRAALGNGTTDASTSGDASDDEVEETTWSIYDKGAAAVTMAFFVAYAWQPLRDLIGGIMDVALGPLEQAMPFYAVVMVLAMATGLYSTLLQANLMNTEKMGQYQEQMQDLQERREAAKERDDQEALDRLQDEQMDMMGDQLGMFKEQFRPMVWIMFFTIPVFLWMYWALGIGGGTQHIDPGRITIPLRGPLEWREQAFGPIQVWILWYFVCSMGFTQIIRKGLNIDISPSPS
ncbi:MAG: DUF106 domain-containing protein [Haloferacaceae archaeon]